MMKKLIIRLLFSLIGPRSSREYQGIDDKSINKWLERQYRDPGFHDYIRKRDITLLKSIGTFLPRDDYAVRCGQRLELMTLLQDVNDVYEKFEKERRLLREKVDKEDDKNKKQ